MNSTDLGKSMFTEVHKLLTIYLTVPMTSATVSRTNILITSKTVELFKVHNDSEET